MNTSKSERLKLLKDSRALFLASLVERVLGAFVGIIVAKVLGPADFGVLKVISHVPTLVKYGAVGFSAVGKREVPLMRESGASKIDEQIFLGRVFTADLVWSLALSAMVLATSTLYDDPTIAGGLIIAAVGILISQVAKCLDVMFCIEQNFGDISKATVLSGFVTAIFTLATLQQLGMFSVLLSAIVGGLATCVFLYWRLPSQLPKPGFNIRFLARTSSVAVPISITTLSSGLMGWVERILILTIFNPTVLGVYMFIIFIIDIFSTLVNSAMKASAIKIFSSIGKSKHRDFDIVLLPSILITILLSFFGGIFSLLGPWLFASFLPEYQDISDLIGFIVLILVCNGASAFLVVAMQSRTLNQQVPLSLLSLFVVIVFSVFTYVASFYLPPLTSVVVGKIVATFFRAIGVMIFTFNHFFQSLAYLARFLVCILSPLILLVLPCEVFSSHHSSMSLSCAPLLMIALLAAVWICLLITRKLYQLDWALTLKRPHV